jgi:4-hydroxy-3-methylbut-2-en-1-yl diphosphate reductase
MSRRSHVAALRIEIASLKHTGVKNNLCFGITRTIQMGDKKGETFHTDNPVYVYFSMPVGATQLMKEKTDLTLKRRYEHLGREVISLNSFEALQTVPDGAEFIMGTRGGSPQVREQAKNRFKTVMDTTCPYVTAQDAACRKLLEQGYQIVFCGLREYHGQPRLQGIAQEFGKKLYTAETIEDVEKLPFDRSTPVGVILQTTWHMDLSKVVVAELVARFREVRVIDTSCIDSQSRVPAARKLAEENDVVVVLDIGQVAKHLVGEVEQYAKSSEAKVRAYRISNKEELRPEWFEGVERVGLIGGVNVNSQALEDVAKSIRDISNSSETEIVAVTPQLAS